MKNGNESEKIKKNKGDIYMSEEQYWRRPLELEINRFKAFGEDCKTIIELAAEDKIRVRDVKITDEIVRFNCYETFYIDRILDLKRWENPFGEGIHVARAIISNDPDYKYPDLRVSIGEGTDAKDYYLQTCRTNWKDNRLVVIACLVALKHRFPDIWIDSDTIDSHRNVVLGATKFAGRCIESRKDFANESGIYNDHYKNPYFMFESLKKDLHNWIRETVREDGDKLNKLVQDAKRRKQSFYTDEFQNKAALALGYTNIGEISQLVDAEDGRGNSIVKTRMLQKVEENGMEICIGFDTKGRLVASVAKMQ